MNKYVYICVFALCRGEFSSCILWSVERLEYRGSDSSLPAQYAYMVAPEIIGACSEIYNP